MGSIWVLKDFCSNTFQLLHISKRIFTKLVPKITNKKVQKMICALLNYQISRHRYGPRKSEKVVMTVPNAK